MQLLNAADETIGISLKGITVAGLLDNQSTTFEYVATSSAKVELNGADNVATTIAQNASGTTTGLYAYVKTDGATSYDTGRGVSVTMATTAAAGDIKDFTYEQANKYSVNVSTATRAGQYMTTANSALDKVTSAL